MLQPALAIPSLLLTWTAMAAFFTGLGALIARLFRILPSRASDSFWLGVAAFYFTAQIVHLFSPISILFLGVMASAAMIGLVRARPLVVDSFRDLCSCPSLVASIAVITIWLAWRALQPGQHIDSIVYQYHAVRWPAEYAIVPGLGNLNSRLGFNTISCLLNAMLEASVIWTGCSARLVNSFWCAALLVSAAVCTRRIATSTTAEASDFFGALVTLPVAATAISSSISSPTSDPPSFTFAIIMLRFAARMLFGIDQAERTRDCGLTIMFAALAAAAKVSQLPLAAPTALLALLYTARAANKWRLSLLPWRAIGLALILATVWCIRSAILTGFPLYPLIRFRLPFDWTLAPEFADLDSVMVSIDAFRTDDPLASSPQLVRRLPQWIRTQLSPMNITFGTLPLLASLILLPVAGMLRPSARHRPLLLLLIPCGMACVAWSLTAPQSRFAAALAWGAFCTLLFVCGSCIGWRRLPLAVVSVSWLATTGFSIGGMFYRRPPSNAIAAHVELALAPSSLLAPPPTPVTRTLDWPLGLPIHLPPAGAKGCSDSPLPATPFLSRSLTLREHGSVARGFRVSRDPRRGPDSAQFQTAAEFIAGNSRPGDHALVLEYTDGTWEQLRAAGAPNLAVIAQPTPARDTKTVGSAVAAARIHERFWLVVSDHAPCGEADLTGPALYFADYGATRLDQIDLPNMSVYLFETR